MRPTAASRRARSRARRRSRPARAGTARRRRHARVGLGRLHDGVIRIDRRRKRHRHRRPDCLSRVSRRPLRDVRLQAWAAGVPAAQRNASTRDFTEPSTARRLALRSARGPVCCRCRCPQRRPARCARRSSAGTTARSMLPLLRGRQNRGCRCTTSASSTRRCGGRQRVVLGQVASDISTSSQTDVPRRGSRPRPRSGSSAWSRCGRRRRGPGIPFTISVRAA